MKRFYHIMKTGRRRTIVLTHTGQGPTCYGIQIADGPTQNLPVDETDPGYIHGGSVYRVACKKAWKYLDQRR